MATIKFFLFNPTPLILFQVVLLLLKQICVLAQWHYSIVLADSLCRPRALVEDLLCFRIRDDCGVIRSRSLSTLDESEKDSRRASNKKRKVGGKDRR